MILIGLFLVTYLPQEGLSQFGALSILHPAGGGAVDHPQDATPLFALGDDRLAGVGGGAEDPADLGAVLDGVEDVDGIGLFQEYDEAVAGPDGLGVLLGQADHLLIGSLVPDQAVAGGLAEGQPELDAGDRGDQDLVEVLYRLDEVGLPQDEVDLRGLFDGDDVLGHGGL